MPTIKEYRVAMPFTLEEFQRARQWHKVEQTKLEKRLLEDDSMKVTEFGERILVREQVVQIPTYFGQGVKEEVKGEHLLKGYGSDSLCTKPVAFHLFARIGSFMDIMIANSIRLTEVDSWEAFPYFRSVSTNSSLRNSYRMIIEGVCLSGNHTNPEDNPLQLSDQVLKNRQLVIVDIADNVSADDYRDGKDPILFRSEKTGRGPLNPGTWTETTKPVMTCAIIISIQFDLLGPVGSLAERRLHQGLERAMRLHHRELFCYIDEWIDKSMEEMLKEGKTLQDEVEGLVEKLLGGENVGGKGKLGGNLLKEKKDEEGKLVEGEGMITKKEGKGKKRKLDQLDLEEETGKGVACGCPITYMRKKISELCSAQRCGGSVGYSYMLIGSICCVVSVVIAIILSGN